ncbi:phosphotransferase [Conexibacter sp. SYSU D00693]|uniref:phosphotransferase n=1 Tax=Conexibacter sp. SYSU D00693 TaxID=2812560 RepID=UPI00196B35D9|nr:phosphotransferase [Conexibacter sp. SYSU D00693]
MASLGAVARTAPTLARVVALAAGDRLRGVPAGADAVTPAWLSSVLGADVVAVEPAGGSSGTTDRRRLRIRYGARDAPAGGLPDTVFTKSAPSVRQRITQAITGPVEARFYRDLRPRLDLEAPVAFGSVWDERRMTSLVVLEDLVATKGATFLDPTTRVDRGEAEQVVVALARLHRAFAGEAPTGLRTYPDLWATAHGLANIERYFLRCFDQAGDLIHPALAGQGPRAWRAMLASVDAHRSLPATVIHGDVHLGNWYRTADGRMGLSDWQVVGVAHGSRDLAYAIASMLTIEDRRAWDDDLLALYAHEVGGDVDELRRLFRGQLWGALGFWAPTYSPPRLMPSDMQPREVSGEMLRRITTACADHGAFGAVGV